MQGMAVQAAAFTGPMWGIHLAPHLRLPAKILSNFMPRIGRGAQLTPGSIRESYVRTSPFEDNQLTTDPQMFDMMRDQITAHPELSLGGPSYVWLREATAETNHLASRAAPNLSCVTWLGTNERIVDVSRIEARMESWQGGRLERVEGAEHEVLMERSALRTPIFDALAKLFLETVTR